ncbi:hypothetical protein [uncultured Tenacibaculum sp.]|uniref:hypothetical protein n=1 Tax=uncultured Tenacibaculum sp. TaxID=174713 RepID=UPI00261BA823|nr:hypothetical protein [uncultured Tenacibaculum sp.]
MKSVFKVLSIFMLIAVLNSCQNEEEQLIPNESSSDVVNTLTKEDSELSARSSNICNFDIITANRSNIVRIGEVKTFTVSNNVPNNVSFKWSVIDGAGIQILGSTTSRTFTIKINSGFRVGAIRLETNYSGNCNLEFSIYLNGSFNSCSSVITPPTPSPIYSNFRPPVPDGYFKDNLGSNYICVGTIANELSVPYEPCTTYNWSISPAGNDTAIIYPSRNNATVIVKKAGIYKVNLTTSNRNGTRYEQFILRAENCDTTPGGGGFGGF